MRTRTATSIAALILGSLLLATGTAQADPGVLGAAKTIDPDEQASRAFMTEFGVDVETQDQLLALARSGGVALADSGTADPVDTTRFTKNSSEYEVATFADGSISVVEREIPVRIPDVGVQPYSVTGCTVRGSSGYTTYNDCKVHYRTAVFSYGFYSTFTMTGSSATISTAYGQFQEYSIGHTRDSWALSIIRKTGNASSPAHVQLRITYTVYPGIAQINKGVRLKADGRSYWQENS